MKLLKPILLFVFLIAFGVNAKCQDSLVLRKIYDEALVKGDAYENLRYLCKEIGPRLSGSSPRNSLTLRNEIETQSA